VGEHRRAADPRDAVGELDHLRGDAGHLGDDDDRRAVALPEDRAALALRLELAALVVLQRHGGAR
jgi:hypothetical protein